MYKSRFILFLLVFAAFAALLSLYMVQWHAESTDELKLVEEQFPDWTQERASLQPESSSEAIRFYKYAEDGFTKVSADVHFRDGSRGYINYRPDGTVSTFGTMYLASKPESSPRKMEAEYDVDGTSLLFERHFRENGELRREGRRQADGSYLVREFFEGGDRLAAEELYDKNTNLVKLEHWYANGNLKKTVGDQPDRSTVTVEYYEDGARKFYHRLYMSEEIWERYQEDGKTLITRFEMVEEYHGHGSSYHILAQYYNPDGSLNHERKFGRSTMEVRFYKPDGEVAWVQVWNHRNWSTSGEDDLKLTPDQYVLHAVYLQKEPFKGTSYWFYEGGEKLRRQMYLQPVPGAKTRYLAHKDYDEETGLLKEWKRFFMGAEGKVEHEFVRPAAGETDEKFDYSVLPEGWDKAIPYVVPPRPPYESEEYDD